MARLPSAGRSIAIFVAIALAAAAVYFIYQYVNGIEDQVREDVELVEVFVATDTIPAGTQAQAAVSAGLVERDEIPRQNRPAGAITALEEIQGLVAADQVLPGEIILAGRFADPASTAVEFEVPEGLQAISLEVGIPPGVAGYVRPGDRISVLAHIAVPEPQEPVIGPDGNLVEPEGPEDGAEETRAEFLVQDLEVLAIGRRVLVTNDEGREQDQVQQTESVLATLAVTDQQAEQLVFALNEGSLYFTLLAEGYEAQDTPGRTFDDLFQSPQS